MEYYVYVLSQDGSPLMPTTRYGRVRRLLKEKKAEVAGRKPFTIRLLYSPGTQVTQEVTLGIDPGRTNIGLAAVRSDGTCLFAAECATRNKEMGIQPVDGAPSEGDGYVIRQFRRHDRARIQYQRERAYYLDKEKVALNRKPRFEQKGEALSDWFSRMEKAYGKTDAGHMRSRLRVKKSHRSYNTPGRVLPGAVCLYQGKYFIMGGQQNEGDYYYPLGEKKKLVPSKDITVACQKGLVFI